MPLAKKSFPALQTSLLALSTFFTQGANAADFTLSSGTTYATQTLADDGDVGIIGAAATLDTDGENAVFIDTAIGAQLTNNGAIYTRTSGGHGIFENSGSGNIIINNGTLSTEYTSAVGVLSSGATATITNSGTITTAGDVAYGIRSTAADATITNSGAITTGGDFAYGILSSAADATITNSGTITTAGDYSRGIRSNGDDATITNSGAIITTNTSAHGIFSAAADATITNSGTITTAGYFAFGIRSTAADATITNSGTITTAGDAGHGIHSAAAGATITNSGTITTAGDVALGILSTAEDATITNGGTITTAGDYSHGIRSTAADATITNSGTITTAGDYLYGIVALGANATIINSGDITVSGNAAAVNLDKNSSDNSALTNSGKIIASGSATAAIVGGSGDQTVILAKGSEIIGTVDLGTGTDSVTATGNGISTRVATTNSGTLSIASNVAGLVIGESLHTVDPTGSAMLTTGINKLSLNIHSVINSHNNQRPASNLSNSNRVKKSPMWASAFTSNFDRGADSGNLAYRNQSTGFVGGYELDAKNSKGLIFGVSDSDLETKSSSFKTKATSFFAGAYKSLNLARSTSLKFNLLAGYERYESKRTVVDNINGYQTAKANFSNFFISPSATLEHKIKLNKMFELNPVARLSYTASMIGEGKEKGTTSANIITKSRQTQAFNSRIGVNAVMKLRGGQLELGTGFDTRIIKEGKVKGSIDGNSFRFNTNNDQNVNGHYLRAGARITNFKGVSILGSFEKRTADGNENEYFGQLGAAYRF
jgi:hypothetical protein